MLHERNGMEAISKVTASLSVVVAADGDGKGLSELLSQYRAVLDAREESYEFIVAFDHSASDLAKALETLGETWPQLVSLPQRPWTGEDAALKLALQRAVGDIVMTLPSWPEIDPASIGALRDAVENNDMVVAEREGLDRSAVQKLRASATHGLLSVLFKQKFRDVFCRARAGRRDVFLRAAEMGVRQHFLPLIAVSEGYSVKEVSLPTVKATGVYKFKPNAHVGALVDVMTLFVGLKFLRRPLRFFGSIGVPLIILGALLVAYLAIERLVFGTPLADRPALVFSVMTLVLGIQIVALGLVGEIIIFSSTRRLRSYEIDEIIRGRPSAAGSDADAVIEAEAPPQSDEKQA